jgi:hypothetical protein
MLDPERNYQVRMMEGLMEMPNRFLGERNSRMANPDFGKKSCYIREPIVSDIKVSCKMQWFTRIMVTMALR